MTLSTHLSVSRYIAPLALTAMFLGSSSSVAIGQNTIDTWGEDSWRNLRDTPVGNEFTQLDGGRYHSVALRADSSIVSWGSNSGGISSSTPTGTGFIQVAAGGSHSLALATGGTITSWGGDSHNQVSQTPTTGRFESISGGDSFSMALHEDGHITSWGWDNLGQVSNTPAGTDFIAISAGGANALALRADGSVVAWGNDADGMVTNAPTGTGFTAIQAGYTFCLALDSAGTIHGWGGDHSGQVSDIPQGTGFTKIAIGRYHGIALRANGTVAAWGYNIWGHEAVDDHPKGSGYTDIASGWTHSFALAPHDSGTSYCHGDGTGAACPCNTGRLGEGCGATSWSTYGVKLRGFGNPSISDGSFRLFACGVHRYRYGLVFQGANQSNAGLGLAVGDGLLCTGGQVSRSQVLQAGSSNGTPGNLVLFKNFNGQNFSAWSYGPGVPVNYQYWFRETGSSCTGAGFNFSNAWTVTWML